MKPQHNTAPKTRFRLRLIIAFLRLFILFAAREHNTLTIILRLAVLILSFRLNCDRSAFRRNTINALALITVKMIRGFL